MTGVPANPFPRLSFYTKPSGNPSVLSPKPQFQDHPEASLEGGISDGWRRHPASVVVSVGTLRQHSGSGSPPPGGRRDYGAC
jgi:hypothetical protein